MLPKKPGVDWFPLDTHLDDKFELIEAEFGLVGFAILLKLFQRIYGGQGYYCEWNDEIAHVFARICGVEHETVKRVVARAVERELFHGSLLSTHHILTSKGIQKRYRVAARRKKGELFREEYLLIPPDEKDSDGNVTSSVRPSDGGTSSSVRHADNKNGTDKSRSDHITGYQKRKEEIPCADDAGISPYLISNSEEEPDRLYERMQARLQEFRKRLGRTEGTS